MPDQVRHDEKWVLVLGRFREADALLTAAGGTKNQRLYDRLGTRHEAAVKRLLRVPAPDLGALAFKLDLVVQQQAWEMTGGALCLAALQRDAHRFASG